MWEEFASKKSKPNLYSGAKKPASVGLVQVTGIFSGATSVKQEEGPVTPVAKYTLTINPTPSDAKVTINGIVGNSYTAREGFTLNWSVEADGYETKTGELTLMQDETISVSLELKKYTFAINPTPSNAKVVINGTEGSSFVLEHGSLVSWSVSAENYTTKTGELTLAQDTTLDIVLEEIKHTFTINPNPVNAKVIINGIERKSITTIQGSEIVWSVSAENYTTKSGTLTLTQTEVLDVELEAIKHTFTINATPDDAVVVINGIERKSITTIQGSEIVWSVSATGYTSQNGSFVLNESSVLDVSLDILNFLFTVNPTPSDAKVTINGQVINSLNVAYGTTVSWSVEKEGYTSKSGEQVITQNTVLPVSLEINRYTFAIEPTPANAKVIINGVETKSVIANHGATITWSIEANGYESKTGSLVITKDTTLPVALDKIQVTFTINPTPSDAKVVINGTETKSVTVDYGSKVVWSVSSDGYSEKTGEQTVTQDTSLNINLSLKPVTFKINPTPANAVVKINGQETKSLTVEHGTQIKWSVSATGYTAQSGELVATEDKVLVVELEKIRVTLTINANPSDAVVTINGQTTNSLTVDYGTSVSWSVEAEGYDGESGSLVLTETKTLDVDLSLEILTFTINPTPADAVVTINGIKTNSLTTTYGSNIEWTVSANGYVAQSGDLVLRDDTIISVELELVKYTLTIVPTPAEAVVMINGEERNTFTAVSGTNITWKVSASGYSQQNGTLTLNADETLEVVLEKSGVQKIEGNSTLWILKTTGDLYATGSNTYGQVGNGGTDNVLSVTKIASNVSDMSAYSSTTAYITKTNELLTCGNNANGQVGNGTSTTKVTRFGNRASDVKKVMADANTTFYLTNGGVLYGCGSDSNGQQGNGSSSSSNVISFEEKAKNVKDFYVGNNLTAYITNNNELYLTGLNGAGQQGSGDKTTVISFTKRADNVESCALTDYNSFYLTPSGELYGTGSRFLLGDYSENQTSFVKVAENVKSFSAGYRDLFYIDTNNVLYGLGRNESGVQGDGTTTQVTSFVKKAENVKKVIVTQYTAGYLTFDGEFYLCGVNTYGQQGNGTTDSVLSFTKRADNVKDIHLGTQTTFYVTNDEEVYGCGRNANGQIGNGTTDDVLTFTKVNI